MSGLTKALAKEIASTLERDTPRGWGGDDSWDALRVTVELMTYGELDPFQLDMLTDWVELELYG